MVCSIKTTFVILTVSIFIIFEAYCQYISCPRFFEYNKDNEGYYAVITIPVPVNRQNLVQVSIAIPGKILKPDEGVLKLLKTVDLDMAIWKLERNIKYRLDFPQSETWPIVVSIKLNNKTICKDISDYNTSVWSYNHTFTYPLNSNLSIPISRIKREQDLVSTPFPFDVYPRNPFLNGEFFRHLGVRFSPTTKKRIIFSHSIPDNGDWILKYKYFDRCGKAAADQVTHTIIGGQETMDGQFPWMVAIYKLDEQKKWQYICGGSLISNEHVLTAAHCLPKKSEFRLELGRYDLDNSNEPYETRLAKSIFRNAEYIAGTAHADIAIILISEVIFSTRIIPVCIWAYGNKFDSNFTKGYISGWGIKERGGDRNNVLLITSANKTTLEECQNSHPLLRRIATAKTFCAKGNTTGPCNGDSGSGFLFNTSKGYFLRGIISTSIGRTKNCNVMEYAVYVDVTFFLNWIRSIIT